MPKKDLSQEVWTACRPLLLEHAFPMPGGNKHPSFGCAWLRVGLGFVPLDAQQAFVQPELEEVVFIRLPSACGHLFGNVGGCVAAFVA